MVHHLVWHLVHFFTAYAGAVKRLLTLRVCNLHMPSFTSGVWHKHFIFRKPKTERTVMFCIMRKTGLRPVVQVKPQQSTNRTHHC